MTKEEILAEIAKTKTATEQLESGDEEQGLLEELERAKLRFSDAQAIKAAESEHGPAYRLGDDEAVEGRKIAAVRTDLGVVIVKRPHQALMRRFVAGKDTPEEAMKLVGPLLVHPPRAAFEDMLKQQDLILVRVVRAASELAGHRFKELSGK